jgi:hypothetical protein
MSNLETPQRGPRMKATPPKLTCLCGCTKWFRTHALEYQLLGHVAYMCEECHRTIPVKNPRPRGFEVFLDPEAEDKTLLYEGGKE